MSSRAGRALFGRLIFLVVLVLAWGAAPSVGAGQAASLPARGSVSVAFSPWDEPERMLIEHIEAARQTVQVQAYAFTSRDIARALVAARARGVAVEVLADARMNALGNPALQWLLDAGVALAFETRYQAAHNKVVLVDAASDETCAVLTGSYNFTWSARHANAENLLALRGNPALCRQYLENWRRHRAEAEPVARLPWRNADALPSPPHSDRP